MYTRYIVHLGGFQIPAACPQSFLEDGFHRFDSGRDNFISMVPTYANVG